MKKIKTIVVRFNREITGLEIPKFRGAVLKNIENPDILFHHHIEGEEKFLYKYPKIQYKTINKKAALFCLEEGVEVVHEFFSLPEWEINLDSRKLDIAVENVNVNQFVIQAWDKSKGIEEERKKQELKLSEAKLQHQQQAQLQLEQQKLELEAKKKEFENLISQAQSLYQNNENKSAISLIEQAEVLGLDNDSHHELKLDVFKAVALQTQKEEIEALKQQDAEKRKAETEAKLSTGLVAYLEEKNLKNDFKVHNFGMLKAKVEKYLKDSAQENLPENEWEVLKQNINRVFAGLKSRDQKEWHKFDNNKIWMEITKWTNGNFSKSVYDNLF